jgi:hypothetical protein
MRTIARGGWGDVRGAVAIERVQVASSDALDTTVSATFPGNSTAGNKAPVGALPFALRYFPFKCGTSLLFSLQTSSSSSSSTISVTGWV